MNRLLLLFGLLIVAGPVAAQSAAPAPQVVDADQPYKLSFYWENDAPGFVFFDDTDRYYTNGLGLSFAWQPAFIDDLIGLVFEASDRSVLGVHVGQHIYTPRNTLIPGPQQGDRPWAGYLYGGAFVERIHDNSLDHFQLDVGMVGPSSLAEEAQEIAHSIIGDNDPAGWNHQLRDEVTVQFYFRKKWRFDVAQFDVGETPLNFQAIPQLGLAAGTVQRHLEGGILVRLGYQLPDDFGPSQLNDLQGGIGTPRDGLSAYGFARFGGQLVEHDIFLDGNNYRDSPWTSKNPLVGQMQFGVALGYRWDQLDVELAYSRTWVTVRRRAQRHAPVGHRTLRRTGRPPQLRLLGAEHGLLVLIECSGGGPCGCES